MKMPNKSITITSCLSVILAVPFLGMTLASSSSIASASTKASSSVIIGGTMTKSAPKPSGTMMSPKPAAATSPVSVNKGSEADLQKVKGIGPVTAKKVIANRPYKTLDDLVTKKVLTPAQLKTMKPSLSL
jgi:competence protein ComEA